jgi:hypothetical protein
MTARPSFPEALAALIGPFPSPEAHRAGRDLSTLYNEAVRESEGWHRSCDYARAETTQASREADRLRAALRESEKALTFAAARMRDLGYERDRQLAPMCEDAAFHARALLAAPAPDGAPA